MLLKDWCNSHGERGKQIEKEFNYEKNAKRGIYLDTITHGSNKKAVWTCQKCGGTWEASVHSRVYMNGDCPLCAVRKFLIDLKSKTA